jgi:PilZ domain
MTFHVGAEQRGGQRVAVALDVHLGRDVGNDVVARTEDLSVSGARVVCGRPLRVDEELELELLVPAVGRLRGRARVLRQHRPDMYALRFEGFGPQERAALGRLVDGR